MGAWSPEIFGNDDSVDWAFELAHSDTTRFLLKSLEALNATPKGETPDRRPSNKALAAAEFVAAIRGVGKEILPKHAAEWLERINPTVDDRAVAAAVEAVERVGAKSDVQELWDASKKAAEWRAVIADLQTRLRRAAEPKKS